VKLGVFTVPYRDLPFEEMLDTVAGLGLDAVELGTGDYPGDAHCPVDELLADPHRVRSYRQAIRGAYRLRAA
jgi:sugar phosphate isomerase/epimerase